MKLKKKDRLWTGVFLLAAMAALLLCVRAHGAIPVFDATWGVKPDLPDTKPILWANRATWGCDQNGNNATWGTSEARVRAFARACRDGDEHWQAWGGPIEIKQGTLICLDFEQSFEAHEVTPKQVAKLFAVFHDEAPGVRLTTYFGNPPGLRLREEVTEPAGVSKLAAATRAAILAAKNEGWGEAAYNMDLLCPDVYLLGEPWKARDLTFALRTAKVLRQYYPDKPVFAWITGYYTWPGQVKRIDDIVLRAYIEAINKGGYDGIVVWGPYEQNDRVFELLRAR